MSEVGVFTKELPYIYGGPKVTGTIRQSIDDFFVDEDLGFEPDGDGHHVLLHIEKRDTNTLWLVKQLARYAQLPVMEIGYAGLKDRHAVTRQWLSVHLAGRDLDWAGFNSEHWRVLNVVRHKRKLRPGFLKGNRFRIVVRNVLGEFATLEYQLKQIKEHGIANYFGEQRFGYDNIERALAWLSGELVVRKKQEKGILLSSLRSAIFNEVLAERVKLGTWNQALAGDVMMLAGNHSVFSAAESDDTLKLRLENHDISPTGPLWGEGESMIQGDALVIESKVLALYAEQCAHLSLAGLKAQRRSFIRIPESMTWQIDEQEATLALHFGLSSGSYATCVLRELVRCDMATDQLAD